MDGKKKRYGGPLRPGMRFWTTRSRSSEVVRACRTIREIDISCTHSIRWNTQGDADTEDLFREERELVRPSDDDVEAWKLFIPDAPLTDTGPKTVKVGQTWLVATDYVTGARSVFTVESMSGRNVPARGAKVLAGITLGGMDFDGFFKWAVLLFDAPETVAKPADRSLAPGWSEVGARRRACSRCGDSTGRQFYICSSVSEATSCERCAPFMGVFVAPPIVLPSAEQLKKQIAAAYDQFNPKPTPTLPRCGKCSHAGHSGPCGGSSPNGCFSCPCGDLTAKDAKLAARGAYAVGTYKPDRQSDSFVAAVFRATTTRNESGPRETLLANLASEKPTARELPRVRDIYLPGASDDGDGLPNREVG